MTFGSLFAGIGGLDLGLERAGMECRWQVEIDPFCRRVLAKHWPDVPRYEDVRDVGAHSLEPVDLICGGFPCVDLSLARNIVGVGDGMDGSISAPMWGEMARIVLAMSPRFVLIENVPALMGHLAALSSDTGMEVCSSGILSAAAMGAPHVRKRCFVLLGEDRGAKAVACVGDFLGARADMERGHGGRDSAERDHRVLSVRLGKASLADTYSERGQEHRGAGPIRSQQLPAERLSGWAVESGFLRVANGFPDRVDRNGADRKPVDDLVIPDRVARVAALGNAVVPQVAEWIGRRIMEAAK